MPVHDEDEHRALVAERLLLDLIIRVAAGPGRLTRSTLDAVLLGAHRPPPRGTPPPAAHPAPQGSPVRPRSRTGA